MLVQSQKNNERQINKLGERWGLSAMKGTFGNILVAESIPAKIPMFGIFVIEDVQRDVCEMNQEYTWGCVLRNRIDREGRKAALAAEILAIEAMNEQKRKEEMREEMREYARDQDRLFFGGR